MSNFIFNRKTDTNILDYSNWATGQTGSIGYWVTTESNTTTTRSFATDNFGNNNAVVWKSVMIDTTGTTTNRAGFIISPYNSISIDPSKKYRFSIWVNNYSGSTSAFYFRGYSCKNNTLTGSTILTTNTYSDVNASSICQANFSSTNRWFLVVGHFYPYNWTGTTMDSTSGVYSGNTLITSSANIDYKWLDNTITHASMRVYYPYGTDINTTGYLAYPRIDLIDGNQPSIDYLLRNEGYKLCPVIASNSGLCQTDTPTTTTTTTVAPTTTTTTTAPTTTTTTTVAPIYYYRTQKYDWRDCSSLGIVYIQTSNSQQLTLGQWYREGTSWNEYYIVGQASSGPPDNPTPTLVGTLHLEGCQ